MNNSFADSLKLIRTEKGLSQQELAEKLNVDRSTVAGWETGRRIPDLTFITKISACLGTDVSYLLNAAKETTETPNIIIVDDERIILNGEFSILTETLPQTNVMGFIKPSEAIAYAKENYVAIAFLDIELGRMNGFELCDKLLEANPQTNVVFLTAYPDYSLDAWNTNASGFLTKPLTRKAILNILPRLRHPLSGVINNDRMD